MDCAKQKLDLELVLAIFNEDRGAFVSSFSAGASLISSNNGRPRFSSNPEIQAMIKFGLETDGKEINRKIAAKILRVKMSTVQLGFMAEHSKSELLKIIRDGKLEKKPSTDRL